MLDGLAFVLWNLAARSPARVFEDMRAAVRDGRDVFAGVVRTIAGLIFFAAAALLLVPALPDPPHDFAAFELGTLLVALALDFTIGNDVRALFSPRGAG